MEQPGRRLRELAVLAVILAAYAVSLGRTVEHGYVWDDIPEIANDPSFDRPLLEGLALTQTERSAPELAGLPNLEFGYDSYRPLTFASFWIDITAWGRRPGPLHGTSVVLGGLAILCAYLVARRWLGSAWALVPTALFALHPVQIEAVAYLSGRGDVLAGLFALLATYAALRCSDAATTVRAAAWTAAASLAFAASLLSKEAYIALPLAIGVLVWSRPGRRERWWVAAALLAVAIGYLPFRAAMIDTHSAPPYADALVAAPGTLLEYLRIVMLPFDLSIERLPRGPVVLGWVVAVALLTAAIALGTAWRGRAIPVWVRHTAAGLAWLVLLLGPSLVVVERMNVLADRYLYLPLLGLGIALAATGTQLARWRPRLARLLAGVAIAWTALLLVVAWRQVPVWRDTQALYYHAAELAPDSARAQYRVGFLEIQADRWDRAVPRLERALELDPTNVEALNNLGVYHLRSGRPADAEALLRRAVEANPARFNAWSNLGLAQLAQGQQAVGCASIARALELNPGYAGARANHTRHCAASR